MEYRQEAEEFFQAMNKTTLSLPVDRCLSFGTGRHLSQNLTTKAFLMHILKSLEDRCSNTYSLFNSTDNEDNYFPLRSGM